LVALGKVLISYQLIEFEKESRPLTSSTVPISLTDSK
jgi:hypothetical protein